MSHFAVVERAALNRRSMSLKISFTRDKALPVPNDKESIPDRFGLTIRCLNPDIAGHISFMKCFTEIDSININGSAGILSLNTYNRVPFVSIEIKYSSISISANIPETVISGVKDTE